MKTIKIFFQVCKYVPTIVVTIYTQCIFNVWPEIVWPKVWSGKILTNVVSVLIFLILFNGKFAKKYFKKMILEYIQKPWLGLFE